MECWAPLEYKGACAKRQVGINVYSVQQKKEGTEWTAHFGSSSYFRQDFERNCGVGALSECQAVWWTHLALLIVGEVFPVCSARSACARMMRCVLLGGSLWMAV